MIRKKLIPIAAIILIAGLMVSCSSSNPMLDKAQAGVKNNNFEAAKTAADKYIKKYPNKPLGYYWKGIALGQQGQTTSKDMPSQATPIYKNMQSAFNKANENAKNVKKKPGELARIEDVKVSVWRFEHNSAVKLATDDSLQSVTDKPLEKAISHLNNAVIIEPDSSLSWSVLAQVNGMQKNFEKAAKAQKKFLELQSNPEAKSYLLLAQYYRYSDNTPKEMETLENMQDQFPGNIKGTEMLADAYSHTGKSKRAIGTVRNLVEKDPSNMRYRMSLGTQIYQSATKYQDSLESNGEQIFKLNQKLNSASGDDANEIKSKIQSLKQENDQLREKYRNLTDKALNQLNKVAASNQDKPGVYNTLGIIHQNNAAVLFDQRNMTTNNAQAKKYDERAKEQLRKSMKNYEKAAEMDPDNKNYWRSLFQIYTNLGMDKKAKKAEKKAGMN